MADKKSVIQVDVYSDLVCPWCYVGETRLKKAIEEVKEHYEIRIKFLPFELNPDMPKEGMDRKAYLQAKFGSLETFMALEGRVIEEGKKEGIQFNFGKTTIEPNTFNAHRVIWLASQQGLGQQMCETLFQGFFVDGRDLGAVFTLIDLAEKAGLDRTKVKQFLESNQGSDEVSSQEAEGRKMGINGVPFFVINGDSLMGAHPVESFLEVFERAAES